MMRASPFLMMVLIGLSAQTGEARAANLLFSSGFEGDLALTPPRDGWQDIEGTDSETGATWPARIWGGTTRIQVLTGHGSPSGVIGNSIETVIGHRGLPTRALRLEVLRRTSGATQSPLLLLPTQEPGEFYISMWVRLPPDIGRLLGPGGWAAINPAWKTRGDFRVGTAVEVAADGTPYWRMRWDTDANGSVPIQVIWERTNHRVPVPQGEWFRLEFFTHRGGMNGRAWLKVNGQSLFDHTGRNIGVRNAPIDRIFLGTSYGSKPFPVWIDDVQIWDGVP
jgi:hypothetical protein